jgi:hypothetical protein
VIYLLARLFRSNRPASGMGNDALGELLRGSDYGDVVPEALLQIL